MIAIFRHGITVSAAERRVDGLSSSTASTVRVALGTIVSSGTRLDSTRRPVYGNSGDRVVVRSLRLFIDDTSFDAQKHQLRITLYGFAGHQIVQTLGRQQSITSRLADDSAPAAAVAASSSTSDSLGTERWPIAQRGICVHCAERRKQATQAWWWCETCSIGSDTPDSAVLYTAPLTDDTLVRYAALATDGFGSVGNVRHESADIIEVDNNSVLVGDCKALAALAARFGRAPPTDEELHTLGKCVSTERSNSTQVPVEMFRHVGAIVRHDALRNIAAVSTDMSGVQIEFHNRAGTRSALALTLLLELVTLGEATDTINV